MLDLNGELEWNTYVDIVLGSQFKSLEVVASKLDRTATEMILLTSIAHCFMMNQTMKHLMMKEL